MLIQFLILTIKWMITKMSDFNSRKLKRKKTIVKLTKEEKFLKIWWDEKENFEDLEDLKIVNCTGSKNSRGSKDYKMPVLIGKPKTRG